jgi:hypothetical protein
LKTQITQNAHVFKLNCVKLPSFNGIVNDGNNQPFVTSGQFPSGAML